MKDYFWIDILRNEPEALKQFTEFLDDRYSTYAKTTIKAQSDIEVRRFQGRCDAVEEIKKLDGRQVEEDYF